MKVCFVSHSAQQGGAERALLELIEALTRRGVTCYVLLPWWGPLRSALHRLGVTCSVRPYLWWMGKRPVPPWQRIGRTLLNALFCVGVTARITRWNCDVIYTNTSTVCVGAIAAALLRRPHVWHLHEFGDADHGLSFDVGERRALRFINRYSSAIVSCSHAVAKRFQPSLDAGKVTVIYGAVSIPSSRSSHETAASPREPNAVQCAIVGNIQEGKGQTDAIRAIAELVRVGIRAELSIIGRSTDAGYMRCVRRLTREEGLGAAVRFLGHVDNPFPLIQGADVILMCSRSEAFGRATIEAMRAGKPVVAARSGATPELIREGWNGLCYEPGDPQGCATAIRSLYEHPEAAQQMGRNGQQWASERFSQARYGDEVLALLRRLTSRTDAPSVLGGDAQEQARHLPRKRTRAHGDAAT